MVLALCHQPWQLPCGVAAVNSLLSCRDLTRCTDVANCTRHDAMLRAGYLCHDFPYFNGWGTSKPSPASVSLVVRRLVCAPAPVTGRVLNVTMHPMIPLCGPVHRWAISPPPRNH